ncbi:MAG: hypothetical protein EOP51_23975, partial [Sphingobacteriales bacterium]
MRYSFALQLIFMKQFIYSLLLTSCILPYAGNAQSLWSWGNNLHGELGNGQWGTGFPGNTPAQAGTTTNWKYVDANGRTPHALQADSSLWGWGDNNSGQLGNATTTASYVPVRIGTDNDWVKISTGDYHTVGLKANGTVWTWGSNSFGTLGNGTSSATPADYAPAKVGTDADWAEIAAGEWFTLAIKTNGTLWYWGHDNSGNVLTQTTPLQVGTDADWKTVATGYNSHNIAIKTDGTMWGWGHNDIGQIGQGTAVGVPIAVPTKIGTDNKWLSASVGHSYTLALKTDGTLWAWGWNDRGQLGDGGTTDKYAPQQVGTDTDWKIATAGRKHSLAIKNNGTLWTWGWNGDKQLGDGTTTDRKTPAQVGTATDWVSITGDELYTIGLRKDATSVRTLANAASAAVLYPNPATATINIKLAGSTVTTISDMTGKTLVKSTDKTIDIDALPAVVFKMTRWSDIESSVNGTNYDNMLMPILVYRLRVVEPVT